MVDTFAARCPVPGLATLLHEPRGSSGTSLVATPSGEEASRAAMKHALKRRPVYFAQVPKAEEYVSVGKGWSSWEARS